MSKICQNCGAELEADEVFCSNCGTKIEEEVAPVKAKSKKKVLVTIGIIAVAVLLVAAVLFSFFAGGIKRVAAQKFMNAYMKGRVGPIETLAPEEYWDIIADEYDIDADDVKDDWKDDWKDNYEDQVESDYFEEAYGKDGKMTFRYQDIKEATKDELKSVRDTLNRRYEIDEKDIDELYVVDYTVTSKGDEDRDVETLEIYVVNIDGKWYRYSDVFGEKGEWTEKTYRLLEEASRTEINTFAHSVNINQYHIDDYEALTPEFRAKLHKINSIISAYRYDESNSQVDYFDTNFYYDIETKAGKSWGG